MVDMDFRFIDTEDAFSEMKETPSGEELDDLETEVVPVQPQRTRYTFQSVRGSKRKFTPPIFPDFYREGKRFDAEIVASHLGGRTVVNDANQRGIDVIVGGSSYAVYAAMAPLAFGARPQRVPIVLDDLKKSDADYTIFMGVATRKGYSVPTGDLRDRLGELEQASGVEIKSNVSYRRNTKQSVMLVPVGEVERIVGDSFSSFQM